MSRRALWSLAMALGLGACGASAPAPESAPSRPRSAPVVFAYGTPRGEEFGSANTRGRVTAVLFVTTFDLPSQLMARRLDEVAARHRPRINAGAVALESSHNAPLVEVFRSTLGLRYPVAIVGSLELERTEGAFGNVDRVPLLVVLDRRGREVSRAAGALSIEEIEAALARAER